jgi:hypothetical protein
MRGLEIFFTDEQAWLALRAELEPKGVKHQEHEGHEVRKQAAADECRMAKQ